MARLTVVAAFFNMQREAARTLFTLSAAYQHGVDAQDYQVVVIDNGSPDPIDPSMVAEHGPTYSYRYVETTAKTPTPAINRAVDQADSEYVMVMIDGARMLTPGIVRASIDLLDRWPDAVAYAPSFHLGAQLQNDLVVAGYDQAVEDALLETVDWRADGYELFRVSNARSVPERFGRPTFESNCFAMRRERFLELGGYDDRFVSSGGGIVNWEFFRRLVAGTDPVFVLQGEATFHQFHGGASTNHARRDHPISGWLREYESVVGEVYRYPEYEPTVFGVVPDQAVQVIDGANVNSARAVAQAMFDHGQFDGGVQVLEMQVRSNPNDPTHLRHLAATLIDLDRFAEAGLLIGEALDVAPTQAELHALRARLRRAQGDHAGAEASIETALQLDPLMHEAMFERALSYRDRDQDRAAIDALRRCIEMAGPPHGPYEMQLASALAAVGESDAAWERAWEWIAGHPDDAVALIDLAAIVDPETIVPERCRALVDRIGQTLSLPMLAPGIRDRLQAADAVLRAVPSGGAVSASAPGSESEQLRAGAQPTDESGRNGALLSDRSNADTSFVASVVAATPALDPELVAIHAIEGSISDVQADIVSHRLDQRRPERVLEVGTYLGRGTRRILEATRGWAPSITSVDPGLRHRIFDDPAAHAARWVSDDRVSIVRAFFGIRDDDMVQFDYAHFAPVVERDEVLQLVASVPTVRYLGEFDFVVFDPGPVDRFAAMLQHALLALTASGEVLVRTNGDVRLVEAVQTTALVSGRSVEELASGVLIITG